MSKRLLSDLIRYSDEMRVLDAKAFHAVQETYAAVQSAITALMNEAMNHPLDAPDDWVTILTHSNRGNDTLRWERDDLQGALEEANEVQRSLTVERDVLSTRNADLDEVVSVATYLGANLFLTLQHSDYTAAQVFCHQLCTLFMRHEEQVAKETDTDMDMVPQPQGEPA